MHKSAPRFVRLALILPLLASIPVVRGAVPHEGNIAPKARVTASSTRPEFPLKYVNDGNPATQWSTAEGQTTGQWLQFDWDEQQRICGVDLFATGPWTQTVDIQIKQNGDWVSVLKSGSAEKKVAEHLVAAIKPASTKSLRFVFVGGAAYNDVEIYSDPAVMARLIKEYSRTSIFVAGDLHGHLMGTASSEDGANALGNAEVTVTGATPKGPWTETAKTGINGDFEVPLAFGTIGPVHISVAKGGQRSVQTFDSRDISTQLTPDIKSPGKDCFSLDGTWEFAVDPPKDFPADQSGMGWKAITVPAHWEMEGFTAESGRGAYHRTFTAPEAWQGKRIKLRANAIYSHAQIWVNGKRAGGHEGGFTPFERDITEMVKPGAKNDVHILVDARTIPARSTTRAILPISSWPASGSRSRSLPSPRRIFRIWRARPISTPLIKTGNSRSS